MKPDLLTNERLFIGCLLRSPHEIYQIMDTVKPDMMQAEIHRDIYQAMIGLAERQKPITRTALQANLPAEYDDLGPSVGILMALQENASDAGSATDYAPFICESSSRRKLVALSKWLNKEAGKMEAGSEDLASEAMLRLQAIMQDASPMRPIPLGEAASRMLTNSMMAGRGDFIAGINTGIGPLDEILGLMLGGDLGFIIASQSDGKSALAAQIAMHAAQANRRVLYIQLEMSDEQMAARELAAASGISVNEIHEGSMDMAQAESVAHAERSIRSLPFNILDVDEITVRQIKAQAAAMQRSGGLSLLVVDQLDKIRSDGKHRDKFERLAEVTRDLKKMAKSLKIPVMCLAQRTRSAQRRDDPTPDVLDADAPSIERDADWVIGLWREENWLRRNKPDLRHEEDKSNWEAKMLKVRDVAEVIILKRRRGRAFQQRKLRWVGNIMRFEELSR